MIYVDIVRKALRDLPVSTVATRRGLYEQLRAALQSVLDDQSPQLQDRDKTVELRLLEMTIRRLETDLRAGVDIDAATYVPVGLEQEQARLYALKTGSGAAGGRMSVTKIDVAAHVAALLPQLPLIARGAGAEGYREVPLRLSTLHAVLLRVLRDLASAQGRLGLLWIIIEPMVLVALIVSVYLFAGNKSVMNMELVAFAVTGIVPWLMIRVTISRVSSTFLSNRDLLALPPINMMTVAVSYGFLQFLIYLIGIVVALAALILHGDAEPPQNWVLCLTIFWSLWLFALANGIMLGIVVSIYPVVQRFIMLAMRFLGLASSIFYVSEQFPDELKIYILYNPLAHGFQLLRTAYFAAYHSSDASAGYYIYALGICLILAAACEWARRPQFEPA